MGIFWLASYPKSGNTWLRMALQCLQRGTAVHINDPTGRASMAARRYTFDTLLHVDSAHLTDAEVQCARPRVYEHMVREAREPLLLKVHDAWTYTPADEPLFPPTVTDGVIYIVRDPRDVAVSLAHHLACPMDKAISCMADASYRGAAWQATPGRQISQRLLTWSGHVESWLDAPGIRRHVVRYEEMVLSMLTVLTEVVHFMVWRTDTASLIRAVEATRFATLQAQEESS